MSSAVVVAPRVGTAAALPPLLPTPPRSKMLPLLPTPCVIILPASFATPASKAPKPGRADAVERWDAHKKPACSAAPSSSSSSSSAGGNPGRADAVARWDAHKKPVGSAAPSSSSRSSSVSPSRTASCERTEPCSPASSSSSSCGKPGRAGTCERWDINKIKNQSGRLSPPPSNVRWDINKIKNPSSRTPPLITERSDDDYSNKRPASRGSSAERWDINKKHRSQDAAAAALGSASDRQLTMMKPHPPLFSGPAFFSSPEPGMLPMPAFLLAR